MAKRETSRTHVPTTAAQKRAADALQKVFTAKNQSARSGRTAAGYLQDALDSVRARNKVQRPRA